MVGFLVGLFVAPLGVRLLGRRGLVLVLALRSPVPIVVIVVLRIVLLLLLVVLEIDARCTREFNETYRMTRKRRLLTIRVDSIVVVVVEDGIKFLVVLVQVIPVSRGQLSRLIAVVARLDARGPSDELLVLVVAVVLLLRVELLAAVILLDCSRRRRVHYGWRRRASRLPTEDLSLTTGFDFSL